MQKYITIVFLLIVSSSLFAAERYQPTQEELQTTQEEKTVYTDTKKRMLQDLDGLCVADKILFLKRVSQQSDDLVAVGVATELEEEFSLKQAFSQKITALKKEGVTDPAELSRILNKAFFRTYAKQNKPHIDRVLQELRGDILKKQIAQSDDAQLEKAAAQSAKEQAACHNGLIDVKVITAKGPVQSQTPSQTNEKINKLYNVLNSFCYSPTNKTREFFFTLGIGIAYNLAINSCKGGFIKEGSFFCPCCGVIGFEDLNGANQKRYECLPAEKLFYQREFETTLEKVANIKHSYTKGKSKDTKATSLKKVHDSVWSLYKDQPDSDKVKEQLDAIYSSEWTCTAAKK